MASVAAAFPLPRPSLRLLALAGAAPVVLLVAHLLPADGVGLAVRLAAATACVLVLPGALVLRAVGWPREPGIAAAASLALSLLVVFFALALTFAAEASLALTITVVGVLVAGALVPALLPIGTLAPDSGDTSVPSNSLLLGGGGGSEARHSWLAAAGVVAVGIAFAAVVWWAAGAPGGDALFHLARVRKLAELEALPSVGALNEFRDGGLHPGYAFPLWHGVLALVARLAGVDSTAVVVHLGAVLTPLALLVSYGAGAALFRSWAGGVATAVAQLAQLGFSRAGTGSFEFLALPASASRVLLVPAVLALAFAFARGGGLTSLAAVAAAAFALAVVHPTYAIFVAVPFAGFLLVRLVLARDDRHGLVRLAGALGAIVVPSGLFFLWLLPVVRRTASHEPAADERARALEHYGSQLDVADQSFRLAPEAITRGGPVVVAALVAVPLAVLAARRMWAAFALGGTLSILAILLVPVLFTTFSDTVSLSQARRLVGFLPVPFAIAGAAVLLGRLKLAGAAAALAAGIAATVAYPGEFTYQVREGGPTWPLWVAVVGGAAAVAGGLFLRRRGPAAGTWAAAAAVAFALPVAVAGLREVDVSERVDEYALTPALVAAARDLDPRDVVFADLAPSYRLAAYAPVYVAAAPPAHVGDTDENRPYERRRDVIRFFFKPGVSDEKRRAILSKYGADWLLVDKARRYPKRLVASLEAVYEDERYALYRVTS